MHAATLPYYCLLLPLQAHIFDMTRNIKQPVCSQKVTRKGHGTKIAFNPRHPILLVGDDRYIRTPFVQAC